MSFSILVIDDEFDIRMLLKEILEGAGWSVDVAESGAKGLELLSSKHHPLVICDISMPEMSGLQTVTKIREMNEMCAVVMLTAHSEKEKIIEALQLGAIDYITKPYNPELLIEKIPTFVEVGRRIRALNGGEATPGTLQHQLRMIELFKLNNHKKSASQ